MTADPLSEVLGRTAHAVASRIGEVFDDLWAIEAKIAAAAASMPPAPGRAHFSFLQPLFQELLLRHAPLIEGGGIAYQPGTLADAELWLEWWRAQAPGAAKFIAHDLNPRSIRYYDYANRDWFRIPAAAGHAVAIGPYVDMGGININTVTLTVPARTGHGTHVLGLDVSLSALEAIFLRAVQTPEPTIILVGSNARIIASNSSRMVIGKLADLEKAVLNVPLAPEKYDQLPWHLVVTDR